ncbi:hypothetical protein [Nostoc sp. FACHB-888]|uniref:hypothetical protein n=1 Tax=Nostoc sp. FACHB-888 TaxID=2692842 RepID=UPI001681D6DB|nr:hypothetical protein [Nostoc sp. FACHB-888]MBD2249064.1 hypothetical protein [Nostoc sp. FACHB-888]
MSNFDRLINSVTFGAVGCVGVGILLLFTPAKASSTWVISASVGFLAAVQLKVDSSQRIYKNHLKTVELEAKEVSENLFLERSLTSTKVKELVDRDKKLSSQEIAITKLKQESAQFLVWINKLRQEVSQKSHQSKSLQTANAKLSTEILRDSFNDFNSSLTALIESLSKRYPNLAKDWDVLSYELDKYINLFNIQVNMVISQTNAKDLIEISLAMQHEIISTGAMLKVKAYKSVITYLSSQLQNVMTVTQHEQLIKELNATWLTKNQLVVSTYQKNFQAIKQEFADNVTTAYEEDFKNVTYERINQSDQIEALQIEIVRLQHKLNELALPYRFPQGGRIMSTRLVYSQ